MGGVGGSAFFLEGWSGWGVFFLGRGEGGGGGGGGRAGGGGGGGRVVLAQPIQKWSKMAVSNVPSRGPDGLRRGMLGYALCRLGCAARFLAIVLFVF